jgi:hypothetical protein
MPIKVLIETKGLAFPDDTTQGSSEQYVRAVETVLSQVEAAVRVFAEERIDRTTPLKDRNGEPCGSVEILRF